MRQGHQGGQPPPRRKLFSSAAKTQATEKNAYVKTAHPILHGRTGLADAIPMTACVTVTPLASEVVMSGDAVGGVVGDVVGNVVGDVVGDVVGEGVGC